MLRRVHVEHLAVGEIELPPDQAHHLRDVLRLGVGAEVELFDSSRVARGSILRCDPRGVAVKVDSISVSAPPMRLTIASAIPKGERADWMIEKLSELGVARFVPLKTARAVVTAEGSNKRDRWARLASESAKQSRRAGVMQIDPPTMLADALGATPRGSAWCLATEDGAPVASLLADTHRSKDLTLFVGPEGGWTDDELRSFADAGAPRVGLTNTVLRVETAAIAAAAIVLASRGREST